MFSDLHLINIDKTNLNVAQDRSDYYFNLHSNAKSWCEEKLVTIDLSIDPFSIQEYSFQLSEDFTKMARYFIWRHFCMLNHPS